MAAVLGACWSQGHLEAELGTLTPGDPSAPGQALPCQLRALRCLGVFPDRSMLLYILVL